MAYLHFDIAFFDQFYQGAGFVHAIGQGFLHKYMFAAFDGFFAEFKMKGGGGYHVNGVAGFHESFCVQEAR